MPAYDYDCAACGRRFEVIHGVHADPPTSCPLCGKGPIRKAITAAAIHYKGSGWAKKERRATASSATTKASSDASGRDGGSGSEAASGDAASSTGKSTDGAAKGSGATSESGTSTDSGSSASSD